MGGFSFELTMGGTECRNLVGPTYVTQPAGTYGSLHFYTTRPFPLPRIFVPLSSGYLWAPRRCTCISCKCVSVRTCAHTVFISHCSPDGPCLSLWNGCYVALQLTHAWVPGSTTFGLDDFMCRCGGRWFVWWSVQRSARISACNATNLVMPFINLLTSPIIADAPSVVFIWPALYFAQFWTSLISDFRPA